MKSYVAYRIAPIARTLSDLEGRFCCLNLFNSHTAIGNIAYISYDVFKGETESARGL